MNLMESIVTDYKSNVVSTLKAYKKLAERAVEQLSDEEVLRTVNEESNSVAIIVKHMSGNQRSRFTDFLTADGEKADRNRDTEFTEWEADRESLMARWEQGWQIVFEAIEGLAPADFGKTVFIRGEPHTVVEAINRQLTHYAYHVGQIVFLAKSIKGSDWRSLSVPKGESASFNKYLEERRASGEEQLDPLEGAASFGLDKV